MDFICRARRKKVLHRISQGFQILYQVLIERKLLTSEMLSAGSETLVGWGSLNPQHFLSKCVKQEWIYGINSLPLLRHARYPIRVCLKKINLNYKET